MKRTVCYSLILMVSFAIFKIPREWNWMDARNCSLLIFNLSLMYIFFFIVVFSSAVSYKSHWWKRPFLWNIYYKNIFLILLMNNFHHFIYLIISSRREIGRSLIRTCMKSQFFLHLIYISQQRFREGVKKHIFERTNPPSFYPVGLLTDIDFF